MKKIFLKGAYAVGAASAGPVWQITPSLVSHSSSSLTSGGNVVRFLSNAASSASRPMNGSTVWPVIALGGATCLATTLWLAYGERRPLGSLLSSSSEVNLTTEAARVTERLHKYGLIERKITPDGNCQFRALADQIMADQNRHKEVRTKIIDWLKGNEKYAVDEQNTTTLGDFLDRDQYPSWENYCYYMSGSRAWGDHLTLVAATEAFGVNLWILSSVEVPDSPEPTKIGFDQYITTLSPRIAKPNKTARLAHYHELHYTSLHPNPSLDLTTTTTSPSIVTTKDTGAEPA